MLAPEVGVLLALGDAGADRVALAPELDLALGVGLEVERPGRDLGVAGVGVDHNDVVAIGEVDDRRGALLAELRPVVVSSRTGARPTLPPIRPPLSR